MLSRNLLMSIIASLLIGVPTASSAAPTPFYHWYHAYNEPISTCSRLLQEVASNVGGSYDRVSATTYQVKVRLDGTRNFIARGIMRCLSRGPQQSWVVIISYADQSELPKELFDRSHPQQSALVKELFDRMRLTICGRCSDLSD